MREKLAPWIAAIFCAVLAAISTIVDLWIHVNGGPNNSTSIVFVLFMPMSFFFVCSYLTQLRNENLELRNRLDALDTSGANR